MDAAGAAVAAERAGRCGTALISGPFLRAYRRLLPSMSQTEKEALEAGTVWWDGELFTGAPRWEKLLSAKAPQLTAAGTGIPRWALRGAVRDAR